MGIKTLELFCGTKSFSKVAKEYGCETITVDIDEQFEPDLKIDILELDPAILPHDIDIIWASPPCESFSVASIGRNWYKGGYPKTESALKGMKMLVKTLEIIKALKPRYYFIENPRGMMRKMPMIASLPRRTITYCQYGDTRMKPTDIWTNFTEWKSKAPCKNGDPCHISAPRGSRTGTQGLKNATERGVIPREVFTEIFDQMKL